MIGSRAFAALVGTENHTSPGLPAPSPKAERLRQSRLTAIYVFAILMVAYYGGQAVRACSASRFPAAGSGRRADRDLDRLLDAVPRKGSLDDTVEVKNPPS